MKADPGSGEASTQGGRRDGDGRTRGEKQAVKTKCRDREAQR